jgi:hypothetical protein
MVERSWTAPIDDPDFWNPKLRAPICFNAAAARSYLPRTIKKTGLILAGRTTVDEKPHPALLKNATGSRPRGRNADFSAEWHFRVAVVGRFLEPLEPPKHEKERRIGL